MSQARRLFRQVSKEIVMTHAKQPVVLVAGGGYSGVLAANRLQGRLRGAAKVRLISEADSLTERIRLHQVAVHGGDVRRPYATLLARGVELVIGRVVGLDAEHARIAVESGQTSDWLPYDSLLLTLGSRLSPTIPSTSEHAGALSDVEAAQRMAAALRVLGAGERVVVVGGGLSAIELSAEIAEAYPELHVELLAQELALGLSGPARDALLAGLTKLGVRVREGVRVSELTESEVRLEDGSQLATRLSVLATGFGIQPLGASFGLPTRADGRVCVDEHLRVQGSPNVFVAGDLAAPPRAAIGTGLGTADSTRMSCATAMPLGAHAADQIARQLRGRSLVPYRFGYLLQCISLGRKSGVVAFVDSDDRPSGRVISGRTAAMIKESICRVVMGMLRLERLFAGAFAWPQPRRLAQPSSPRLTQ
jgi:NADH:ubiquinone reductase (H+-translocating)